MAALIRKRFFHSTTVCATVLALGLFLGAVTAFAQAAGAVVSGVVTDASGGVLSGAWLTLADTRTGVQRQATANERGEYMFGGVPSGQYVLSAGRDGFAPAQVANIELRDGERRDVPLVLQVTPLAETISVVPRAVTGQTTDAEIRSADLERWQAHDLADVFRNAPNVDVGGSLPLAQKIYVRGIEDALLNVTVDGAPQTGTLFHHIGRVSVEPELLQQVDVQSGAGEATAGFGAIGGAIRFRTKRAEDLLAEGQRFGALFRAGYFSNAGYRTSLTGYGRLTSRWSALASFVFVDRDNMTDGDGHELFGTSVEQTLGFAKANGTLTDRQRLSVSYEQRDERGEFGQRPNWPVLEGERLFPGSGSRKTGVINYLAEIRPSLMLEASGYRTQAGFEQDRYDRWGLYGATIGTSGFDVRVRTRVGRHDLVTGTEYRSDRVVSEYLAAPAVWNDWAWDPNLGKFEEAGDLIGVYAQDQIRMSDSLLASAGVRYDRYALDQVTYGERRALDGISGNVGVRYTLTPALRLSAGIAQAIRGKEVGDAFTLERRPGRLTVAPDLEPERVTNAETGIVFDNGRWLASASVYRMQIDDVIFDQLGNGPAPQDAVYYENIGTLRSSGIELGAGYGNRRWRANLFFTAYDTELNDHAIEGYEQIGLANAGGGKWTFDVAYSPSAIVEVGWKLTAVHALNDIEVLHRSVEIGWIDRLYTVDKPGYAVHDVYLQWRPRRVGNLTINVAAQNLFDTHYRAHSSVADYNAIPGWQGVAGLYEPGRDVRLSLGVGF